MLKEQEGYMACHDQKLIYVKVIFNKCNHY